MAHLKYRCVFPGCNYETDERRLIEFHHVNPKELGVKLNRELTIQLCPVHHKLIYHPDAKTGQHAKCSENSLSVVQVANTTTGKAVIFRDMSGNEITVSVDTRAPKIDAIYVISWDLIRGIDEHEVTECDSAIEKLVDARGYCQVGNRVFYGPGHGGVAHDLLKAYVAQYMIKTKAEYSQMLTKARQDYRNL